MVVEDTNYILTCTYEDTEHSSDLGILNSEASYHICPYKKSSLTCLSVIEETIYTATDKFSEAVGVGTITIKMFDGVTKTMPMFVMSQT